MLNLYEYCVYDLYWQVFLNHLDAVACLEEIVTTMMMKAKFCEFYAGIYEGVTESSLQDTLSSALPQFHASVIVFSIKTQEYFHARCIFTKIITYFGTPADWPPTRDYKNSEYDQAF